MTMLSLSVTMSVADSVALLKRTQMIGQKLKLDVHNVHSRLTGNEMLFLSRVKRCELPSIASAEPRSRKVMMMNVVDS